MVGPPGLEPGTGGLKVRCDNHFTTIPCMVHSVRFELTPHRLRAEYATVKRQLWMIRKYFLLRAI